MEDQSTEFDKKRLIKRVMRPLRTAWISLAVFISLFILIFFLLRIPAVQQYLAEKATSLIAEKYQTEVTIGSVDVNLFKGVEVEEFYMEDLSGDTLIYAGSLYSGFYNSLRSFYYKDFNVNNLNLENGYLNLKRTNKDPLNNLQRLLNRTYDPYQIDTVRSYQDTIILNPQRKAKPFELALNEINLSNIHYKYVDSLAGQTQQGFLGDFMMEFDTFDIINLHFIANQLRIEDSNLVIDRYQNQELEKPLPERESSDPKSFVLKLKEGDLQNLDIKFNDLRYEPKYPAIEAAFDPYRQEYKVVEADLENFNVTEPYYLEGKVNQLSLVSKGFSIETFEAERVFVNKRRSGIEGFTLDTGRSTLGNEVIFKYRKISDFREFVDKVIMEARVEKSVISLKDLVFFAPKLRNNRFVTENINEKIILSSRITGRVNQLNARDLSLIIADNLNIRGNFIARDLTNPDESLLNVTVNRLQTDITTLNKLIPGFTVPANFYKLNSIDFNGRFDGYYQDFVAYGELLTDLGRADVDMRLDLKEGSQNARYSGKVNLFDFDLATWSNNSDFDKLSLSANVTNGKGLELSTAYAELGGEIIAFDFRNYKYRGIIDATLERNLFDGKLQMNDENIRFDFLGNINFKEEMPLYDFKADVESIDLQALNLSKDITHIEGLLDIKLKGSSIDNIIGSALGNRIQIVRENDTLDFGHLAIASTLSNQVQRSIFVDSDVGNAEITGEYNLSELPDAAIAMIKLNFPSLGKKIKYTGNIPANEVIANFEVNLIDGGDVLSFFTSKEAKLEDISMKGSIDYRQNDFKFDLNTADALYDQFHTYGLNVNFDIEESKGHFEAKVDSGYLKQFPLAAVDIEGNLERDTLYFGVTTQEILDSISNVIVSGRAFPEDSVFVANFSQLQFDLLGDKWRLLDQNEASVGNNYINVENFVLSDNYRSIKLKSINDNSGIETELKEIQLFLVNKWINKDDFILNGDVNATIAFEDIFKLSGLYVKSKIENMMVNEQPMGTVTIDAETDLKAKSIGFDVTLDHYSEDVNLNGTYSLLTKDVEADLVVSGFKLLFLENFLKGNIENTQGTVYGKMHIDGPIYDMNTTGRGEVRDGFTRVNYLGTEYSFEEAKFKISKGFIDFTGGYLRDTREQLALVKGGLTHDNFRNLGLDVNISSEKFILIDTDEKINPSYYGLGLGEASVDFLGPFSNMTIKIQATTGKDTRMTLPVVYVNSTRDQSFIPIVDREKFLEGYKSDKVDNKKSTYVGLELEMNLTVTPDAEMTILFDPITGHKLAGRGSGDIQLFLSPNGNINMYGSYNVDKGQYDFALQNFIKKEFSIRQGGQVVWDGDPLDAQIKIAADYRTLRVPLNVFLTEFLGSNEELSARASEDQDVKLTVNLIDRLLNPTIKFDIDFPNLTGELRSIAENKLTILEADPLGLNNQVFGLLIFNNFLPYNNPITGFGDNDLGSSAANVIFSELVSAQLSAYVSSLLESVLDENGLIYDVDVDVRLDNRFGFGDNTNSSTYGVTVNPKFNSDKFDIILGGDYLTASDQTDPYAAGDFILDYFITRDKKIKIRIYGRTDRNAVDGRRQRIGAGLYVRREFANFKDLRKSFSKIAKEAEDMDAEDQLQE